MAIVGARGRTHVLLIGCTSILFTMLHGIYRKRSVTRAVKQRADVMRSYTGLLVFAAPSVIRRDVI